MRFLIYLLLLISVMPGCKHSAIKQNFSSADSLVIHFKNEQAGEVTKTVKTTDVKAINRIIEFIDGKETGLFKCSYDGKMFFYTKGEKIQEVDFKMKDETCNHFAFLLDGILMYTQMKDEAIDFLTAIESGMPYY